MEIKFYGENSVHVAKTQKIIGTIYILMQNYNESIKYLTKAMKTFEENGMKKPVTEIRSKLKIAKENRDKSKGDKKRNSDDENDT